MRTVVIIFLVAASLHAQNDRTTKQAGHKCSQNPNLLSDAVLHEMWGKDEGDVSTARGFIRIAISSAWDPESFIGVRLNKKGPSILTIYSLPKGTKYLVKLVRSAIRRNPCADAKSIAERLPVQKKTLTANKELESLIELFLSLRLEPRPYLDSVRVDTTEYNVEFRGDEIMRITTDDFEAPVAHWVRSVLAALAKQGENKVVEK